MNSKAYYWFGVGSAFLIGVATGVAGVRTDLERKMRKEYAEREQMMQNAYEQALDLQRAERPVEQEIHLDGDLDKAIEEMETGLEEVEGLGGVLAEGGEIEQVGGNPYHRALEAVETPVELFVDGGVNDYGVSYIDEEDYLDEDDGRFKGKIDILMDEAGPIFMMDGEVIDDWDKRVGDSIMVDFFKLVPPNADRVLYVRNHRTDEDYEVVQVTP